MALNQLKAGIVLSYVTIGLHNVIGLIYTPYMLRMMGQSEYGLYSLVASVIAYLTVLDLGFANAIVRYTAKFRRQNKRTIRDVRDVLFALCRDKLVGPGNRFFALLERGQSFRQDNDRHGIVQDSGHDVVDAF